CTERSPNSTRLLRRIRIYFDGAVCPAAQPCLPQDVRHRQPRAAVNVLAKECLPLAGRDGVQSDRVQSEDDVALCVSPVPAAGLLPQRAQEIAEVAFVAGGVAEHHVPRERREESAAI